MKIHSLIQVHIPRLISRSFGTLGTQKPGQNYLHRTKHIQWNTSSRIEPDYELCDSHSPNYLWIGCSDARIPAHEGTGQKTGNIFVHRNLGNLVLNTDANFMSVLQYAVEYLNIPHIIICGHYDCNAVHAAVDAKDHNNPLENWLCNIRNVYYENKTELNAIPDEKMRYRRLVELNVVAQCVELFKTNTIQRRRIKTYRDDSFPYTQPRIHALVYQPEDGLLKHLKINFKEYLRDRGEIYNLYHPAEAKAKLSQEPPSKSLKRKLSQ